MRAFLIILYHILFTISSNSQLWNAQLFCSHYRSNSVDYILFVIPGGKDDDGGSIKSGLGSLSGSSGLSKKQRKARTAFTDHQLQTLEKSFERQKYLSVQDRMELANKLGLSDTQVKTWYQNRR